MALFLAAPKITESRWAGQATQTRPNHLHIISTTVQVFYAKLFSLQSRFLNRPQIAKILNVDFLHAFQRTVIMNTLGRFPLAQPRLHEWKLCSSVCPFQRSKRKEHETALSRRPHHTHTTHIHAHIHADMSFAPRVETRTASFSLPCPYPFTFSPLFPIVRDESIPCALTITIPLHYMSNQHQMPVTHVS